MNSPRSPPGVKMDGCVTRSSKQWNEVSETCASVTFSRCSWLNVLEPHIAEMLANDMPAFAAWS